MQAYFLCSRVLLCVWAGELLGSLCATWAWTLTSIFVEACQQQGCHSGDLCSPFLSFCEGLQGSFPRCYLSRISLPLKNFLGKVRVDLLTLLVLPVTSEIWRNQNSPTAGLSYSSVVECLPSMHEVLGSIPSTDRKTVAISVYNVYNAVSHIWNSGKSVNSSWKSFTQSSFLILLYPFGFQLGCSQFFLGKW